MKKKSSSISLYVMIAIIALVVSFVNGDFAFGPFLEGLEGERLDFLLDNINLILGFLVLAAIFISLIVRAAREEKEYTWDFNIDDFREGE